MQNCEVISSKSRDHICRSTTAAPTKTRYFVFAGTAHGFMRHVQSATSYAHNVFGTDSPRKQDGGKFLGCYQQMAQPQRPCILH